MGENTYTKRERWRERSRLRVAAWRRNQFEGGVTAVVPAAGWERRLTSDKDGVTRGTVPAPGLIFQATFHRRPDLGQSCEQPTALGLG